MSLLYVEAQMFYHVFSMPHLTQYNDCFIMYQIYIFAKLVNQNKKCVNI